MGIRGCVTGHWEEKQLSIPQQQNGEPRLLSTPPPPYTSLSSVIANTGNFLTLNKCSFWALPLPCTLISRSHAV